MKNDRTVNFSINANLQLSNMDQVEKLLTEILGLEKLSNTVYKAEYRSYYGEPFTILYLVNRKPGNDQFINIELIEINLHENNIDISEFIQETDIAFMPEVIRQKFTTKDNNPNLRLKGNAWEQLENHIKVQAATLQARARRVDYLKLNPEIYEYLVETMKKINLVLKHVK